MVCEDDQKCVRDVCVPIDAKLACDEVQDLGEVDLAAEVSASGNTEGFVDTTTTTCAAVQNLSGAENAFKFTVPAAARVNLVLTSESSVDWVIEVREGACEDAAASMTCSDVEDFDFVVEPGTEYFVVAEPRTGIDRGPFEFTMTFEELVCSPPGGVSCDVDDVVVCQAGTSEARYGCGTGCMDAACLGDSCATAFEVTASTSFAGDTEAFSGTLDFGSQPSCSVGGEQGIATPGPEVVLSLPGLTQGQTVTVDASMNDDNDNAIFVLDQCSDQQGCLDAIDIGEVLTWDVPADGNYFVVIDKTTSSAKPFAYAVDIQ
jgi:hypothetical protein